MAHDLHIIMGHSTCLVCLRLQANKVNKASTASLHVPLNVQQPPRRFSGSCKGSSYHALDAWERQLTLADMQIECQSSRAAAGQ